MMRSCFGTLVLAMCFLACASQGGLSELSFERALVGEASSALLPDVGEYRVEGPMYQVDPPAWWPSSDWSVTGSLMFAFGLRRLEDHLGRAGQEQGYWGVEAALGLRGFPLGVEVGYSSGSYTKDEYQPLISWPWDPAFPGFSSKVDELYFGPRLSFELDEGLRYYVAGGASQVTVSADIGTRRSVDSDRDTTWAGYVHTGLIGHAIGLGIGLDLRWNWNGSVELFEEPVEVGYLQLGLCAGLAF